MSILIRVSLTCGSKPRQDIHGGLCSPNGTFLKIKFTMTLSACRQRGGQTATASKLLRWENDASRFRRSGREGVHSSGDVH